MYLICFGTRPELIKLIPIIIKFRENNIKFKSLFTGQHETLIKDFYKYINSPDVVLENVMEHGQTLNMLSSKILIKMDLIFNNNNFKYVIVQGDTTSSLAISLSAFHNKVKIIHIEAGLRTFDKYNPFPEEINRKIISSTADIHFCPTEISVTNLNNENIKDNVYLSGNTIVDMYKYITENTNPDNYIDKIIKENEKYIIITLHRRENRGNKMNYMWKQINDLSNKYKFVYITHPSLPESKNILNKENIILLDPINYENMVHLITNSSGIITDSGGIQEESVCANKKVLVCRETTERPETISSGFGKLIDTKIEENIDFLFENNNIINTNPYGDNVSDKILNVISSL